MADWISSGSVARRLGVHRTTVVRWTRNGTLKPVGYVDGTAVFDKNYIELYASQKGGKPRKQEAA